MENSSAIIETNICEWTSQDSTLSGCVREEPDQRSLRHRPTNQSPNTEPMGVLIVDDNKLNGAAIRRSFGALEASISVFEVRTCDQALNALHGVHPRIRALPPCVLVLNLDMPGSFEFLKRLRLDTIYSVRNSPVFVHSQSNAPHDRNQAYEWKVAGYIHDRPGRKSLLGLARLLREYIRSIEPPSHEQSINVPRISSRPAPDSGAETSADVWSSPMRASPNGASIGLELVI